MADWTNHDDRVGEPEGCCQHADKVDYIVKFLLADGPDHLLIIGPTNVGKSAALNEALRSVHDRVRETIAVWNQGESIQIAWASGRNLRLVMVRLPSDDNVALIQAFKPQVVHFYTAYPSGALLPDGFDSCDGPETSW